MSRINFFSKVQGNSASFDVAIEQGKFWSTAVEWFGTTRSGKSPLEEAFNSNRSRENPNLIANNINQAAIVSKHSFLCRFLALSGTQNCIKVSQKGDFRCYVQSSKGLEFTLENSVENCDDKKLQENYPDMDLKKTHPFVLLESIDGNQEPVLDEYIFSVTKPYEVFVVSQGIHLGKPHDEVVQLLKTIDWQKRVPEENAVLLKFSFL